MTASDSTIAANLLGSFVRWLEQQPDALSSEVARTATRIEQYRREKAQARSR